MNRQMPNKLSDSARMASSLGLELLSPAEMAAADRATIEGGVPGIALMERAGAAVAEIARKAWLGGPIVVLAGPGNNGGDGWVAARILREAGYRVTVALFGDREALRGDAATAAARFLGRVVPAVPEVFTGAGLIIDALYGAGVRLPLDAKALAMIEVVNGAGAIVVAVDLPSGVEGAGGAIGAAAVKADETITFFRAKPGHVLLPGRLHCGDVAVADIGIAAATLETIGPKIFLNRPGLWRIPDVGEAGHKYDRGHALVLSGPAHRTGAARMAAMGALRIGAGLVTVASLPDAIAANAAHLTAVMLRPMDGHEGLRAILEDQRFNALVLGPGLGVGEETRRLVETALRAGRATVLDADALTSFAGDMRTLVGLIGRSGAPVVVTPHDGEFARLVPDIAGTRLERARKAAERSGAIVLLKGADTVIAAPDGTAAINDDAPPTLATAGSGDVLAGLVGGLLAQGMPAFEAAAAAVWIHGEAAARVGRGLIAEDLPAAVPGVLVDLESA